MGFVMNSGISVTIVDSEAEIVTEKNTFVPQQ